MCSLRVGKINKIRLEKCMYTSPRSLGDYHLHTISDKNEECKESKGSVNLDPPLCWVQPSLSMLDSERLSGHC